jgi:hypothetical protein
MPGALYRDTNLIGREGKLADIDISEASQDSKDFSRYLVGGSRLS